MQSLEINQQQRSQDALNISVHDANEHNDNINSYYDSPAVQFFEELCEQQIHLGYWDSKYPSVTISQAAQRLTQVVIDLLDMPRGSKLLDIGCGCGQPAIDIAKQRAYEVEGLTINPQQQQKAFILAAQAGLSDQVRFRVGDARSLPYEEQHFDGALLLESIHHIGHQEAIAEASRTLKPGGTILIADGVAITENISPGNKHLLTETFVASSLATKGEIQDHLKRNGFSKIESYDLSKAIQPTWKKLIEATEQQQYSIITAHGSEFYRSMRDFWKQMQDVWSSNARYLIFKAHKV